MLPDAVNHRSLQDAEEPVLLGVLWSLLDFPPRGGRWREGGKQVSRLQDNVLVILPAVTEWKAPSECIVGLWGMGRWGCFVWGFLRQSHCPGTRNPSASASTGLGIYMTSTMIGKTTLSGQSQPK